MARFDIQSQVSDHHTSRRRVLPAARPPLRRDREPRHERRVRRGGRYAAKPWDGASTFRTDRVRLHHAEPRLPLRLRPGGRSFFANPLDPTNGTTALHVCRNPPECQNKTVRIWDASAGKIVTEALSADLSWTAQSCGDIERPRPGGAIATAMTTSPRRTPRTQFSPRIGVSFPVTETSQLFFNFGRYSQNPLLKQPVPGHGDRHGARGDAGRAGALRHGLRHSVRSGNPPPADRAGRRRTRSALQRAERHVRAGDRGLTTRTRAG